MSNIEIAIENDGSMWVKLEDFKKVEANYNALQTPMPCGHLARYAMNGEEGTQYCCMCEREALLTVLNVANNIISKTADCIQLLREVDDRVPGITTITMKTQFLWACVSITQ